MKCQKERLVANDKNGANISCESMALSPVLSCQKVSAKEAMLCDSQV